MHAVGGEDELVAECGLFGFGLRELRAPDELAGLGQPRDLHAERDRRDAVMVGDLLHRARGALQLALEHGGGKRLGQGVDEADVGLGIGLPGLAHDAFHRANDALRVSAAVIHRELDEEEVRPFREDVLLHTKDAEVRTGAADGRVDLREGRLRVGLLEMGEGLHPPAVLRGDRTAEVTDLHFGAGRLGLEEEIRQAAAGADFLGFGERVILVGGLAEHGGAQRQGGEEQSHGGERLDVRKAPEFQPIGAMDRKNESPSSFPHRVL